jgi:hypothetical protein
MSNKANSENDVILEVNRVENYEEFSCIYNSLQCYNKMKTVRKQLFNKLWRNTRRHKKIRKLMRMTRLRVNELLPGC